ncbi:MAG: hypothetical protein KBC00_02660 [Candidatus Levybacteria bacterium]|nr:hypothetical protein [Candidatus Levybacteria bacterium]MBP9814900.1 hypothetical protein [Candidatus Levybacteria bacterium]
MHEVRPSTKALGSSYFAEFRRGVMHPKKNEARSLNLLAHFKEPLLPASLDRFNKLTIEEQRIYIAAMGGVERMKSIREQGFPIPRDFKETNLDHVQDALGIAREYYEKFPRLSEFIEFPVVQDDLIVHDIAESNIAIDDRTPVNRTAQDEKAKRLEPYAGIRFLRRISDPEQREYWKDIYVKHNLKDPNNLNVQMAVFIDKAQGTTRAAEIAFNTHNVSDEATFIKMRLHLWETIPRMMEPAMNLLIGLPTQESREDMRKIVMHELGFLERYGPKDIVRTIKKGFAA